MPVVFEKLGLVSRCADLACFTATCDFWHSCKVSESRPWSEAEHLNDVQPIQHFMTRERAYVLFWWSQMANLMATAPTCGCFFFGILEKVLWQYFFLIRKVPRSLNYWRSTTFCKPADFIPVYSWWVQGSTCWAHAYSWCSAYSTHLDQKLFDGLVCMNLWKVLWKFCLLIFDFTKEAYEQQFIMNLLNFCRTKELFIPFDSTLQARRFISPYWPLQRFFLQEETTCTLTKKPTF